MSINKITQWHIPDRLIWKLSVQLTDKATIFSLHLVCVSIMGKKELCPIDNLVPSSLLRKAKPIANYLPYPNKTQCVIMVQHSLNMGHQVCPSTVYFNYVVVSSKVLFRMWQCQVAPLRLSTPSIAQWIKRKLLGARWGTKIKLWPEKPRLCLCFAFLFSTTSLSKKVLKSWLPVYMIRRVNGVGAHNSTPYYHSKNWLMRHNVKCNKIYKCVFLVTNWF